MAIYHLTVKIIGRSSGRSSVAAAAYRSGDILTNEWDGITHDYSRKGWIEHTEIILPEHAPAAFKNRNTLWNAVETAEKSGNAQLAREIEVSLPIELSPEQRLELIQKYIQENFVSKGMCADLAIHNPPITDGKNRPIDAEGNPTNDKSKMTFQNPHAHVLLTMRPLDEQGNWQSKYQSAYLCRKDNTELAIPVSLIKQAEAEGWKKQYQYKMGKKSVWLTAEVAAEKELKRVNKQPKKKPVPNPVIAEWNSKDTLFQWRENWASMCNQALKDNHIDTRIDHRSYAEQGIDKIPSVHLGPYAYHMEKQGIMTELGNLNRQIQSDNAFLNEFQKQIEEFEKKETERLRRTAARLETLRANHIAAAYQQFCFSLSLAQQQDNSQSQIEMAAALMKTVNQMLAGLGTLRKILAVYEQELERTSPIQKQKQKELKDKIIETESQIESLKKRLDETKAEQKRVDEIPVSSTEVLEHKKRQIEYLKEIQSQAYKEFYTLIKENKENMKQLRELIRGIRPQYDNYIDAKIKQHYAEEFKEEILMRAREKAPDIPETETGSIRKNISHKR